MVLSRYIATGSPYILAQCSYWFFQERNWVTVEGLNVEYENMGGDGDFPGMMVKKELPLIVNTDIRLVDPSRSASCIHST